MNKQQRDYIASRIKDIAKGKKFECECEKPSLGKHVRRAIASGKAKMKPSGEIIALFQKRIIEQSDSYRGLDFSLEGLFEEPQSYKDAMEELKSEQRKHADANALVHQYAQSLIDAVELGKYEDGAEPIRPMEAYAPKAPVKATKAR